MKWRGRRGGAAIEFALFLPILCCVLGVITDLGWYFWRHNIILDAAREGARVGADTTDSPTLDAPASEAEIEAAAVSQARAVLTTHGLVCSTGCVVTSEFTSDAVTHYELIIVRVEYPFTPLIGMWPGMDGDVTAEFTMFTAVQT
jgi:Flp pilus assembly protein TadG